MKVFFLLLTLTLVSTISIAQSNFQSGLIVNPLGDTTRGFIDEREWDRNPESILFKKDLTSDPGNELSISEIRYFEVGEYRFERHTLLISRPQVAHEQQKFDKKTVFLKIHDSGRQVTLYSYRDKEKIRYFLATPGSAPTELIIRSQTFRRSDGREGVFIFEGYKKQLKDAANQTDASSVGLNWQINKVSYGDDLARISRMINGNQEVKSSKKNTYHPYAGVGLSVASISYSGSTAFAKNVTDNSPSINPYFLIGSTYGRRTGKSAVSFGMDLMYTSSKFLLHSFDNGGTFPLTLKYSIAQRLFNLTTYFRWNAYNGEKFKAFVGAGLRFSFSSYSDNTYTIRTDYPDGTSNESTKTDFFDLYTFWPSIPIKAGITVKDKFELSMAYTLPNPLNHNANLMKQDISYLQAGVGYYLR